VSPSDALVQLIAAQAESPFLLPMLMLLAPLHWSITFFLPIFWQFPSQWYYTTLQLVWDGMRTFSLMFVSCFSLHFLSVLNYLLVVSSPIRTL
jgi:hypothetical protein